MNRAAKRTIQVLADGILILVCYNLAMYLRLDSFVFLSDAANWYVLIPVIPLSLGIFAYAGLYRVVIRYISSKVLKTIIVGCFLSAIIMFLVDQIFVLPISRSVPIIYVFLLFCCIGGVRFAARTIYRHNVSPLKDNIIIYGAGHSGRQLLYSLDLEDKYKPICFVDDNSDLYGREISGVPVCSPSSLETLIDEKNIQAILLAVPSASANQRCDIISRMEKLSVEVRTIPKIGDLIDGKADVSELKLVKIEELLGRNPVLPDKKLLSKNITGKSVLVTGAGGSIGSELCRQILLQNPKALVLLDISEFSIYNINEELEKICERESNQARLIPVLGSVHDSFLMLDLMKKLQIETVYHAAAYKHVPLVEENVVSGVWNNVFGTQVVAQAAIKSGVGSFTLISTDKAVRPTNIMGASKRLAEIICQALASNQKKTTFSIVRFGNVLGSSGSAIPKFYGQIGQGGPVTVTHPEITRYFMTIPEAAQLVVQASAMPSDGTVFVLDMGESIKIVDLVERMIRLHGFTPFQNINNIKDTSQLGDIEIKFTGLRPGEKLYEELLCADNPAKTEHSRIFAANEFKLDKEALDELLAELEVLCKNRQVKLIRELLLKAPIEYLPNDVTKDFPLVSDNDQHASVK